MGEPFGAYYQLETFQSLLDNGIAVIAPTAIEGLFWQTNLPPYDITPNLWYSSSDYKFIEQIMKAAHGNDTFGPLDPSRAFAFGISSGGYQSSRVAVDMSDTFKAVVIAAGAYMTCGGPLCYAPWSVPPNHPPTMFLHGFIDPIVPYWTMLEYYHVLQRENITTELHTCATCTHQWIPSSAQLVYPFFKQFL